MECLCHLVSLKTTLHVLKHGINLFLTGIAGLGNMNFPSYGTATAYPQGNFQMPQDYSGQSYNYGAGPSTNAYEGIKI